MKQSTHTNLDVIQAQVSLEPPGIEAAERQPSPVGAVGGKTMLRCSQRLEALSRTVSRSSKHAPHHQPSDVSDHTANLAVVIQQVLPAVGNVKSQLLNGQQSTTITGRIVKQGRCDHRYYLRQGEIKAAERFFTHLISSGLHDSPRYSYFSRGQADGPRKLRC